MKNLPQELLDLILAQLIERPTPYQYRDTKEWRSNKRYLCQARLVCQQWNSLATPHLFRNIVLVYTKNATPVWDQILDSKVVQHARSVYIRTSPPDDYPNGYWEEIEHEPYENLLESVKRIEELENIETLYLRFSSYCRGTGTFATEVEGIKYRQQVLENLFTAMHKRRQVERNKPIRSLTIENLQNLPLPQSTSSNLFKDVMKDVNHLHLIVEEEFDDDGPDWHMHCVERRIFEPHLHREWLTPFSNHIVSLTCIFATFGESYRGLLMRRGSLCQCSRPLPCAIILSGIIINLTGNLIKNLLQVCIWRNAQSCRTLYFPLESDGRDMGPQPMTGTSVQQAPFTLTRTMPYIASQERGRLSLMVFVPVCLTLATSVFSANRQTLSFPSARRNRSPSFTRCGTVCLMDTGFSSLDRT
jgi:hypothetical protein